jgi:hypothetical protein
MTHENECAIDSGSHRTGKPYSDFPGGMFRTHEWSQDDSLDWRGAGKKYGGCLQGDGSSWKHPNRVSPIQSPPIPSL